MRQSSPTVRAQYTSREAARYKGKEGRECTSLIDGTSGVQVDREAVLAHRAGAVHVQVAVGRGEGSA